MRHLLSTPCLLAACGILVIAGCQSTNAGDLQENDPRLGAVDLLDAEDVVRARSLIVEGKTYSLALVTGQDTPAFGNRSFRMIVEKIPGTPIGKNLFTGMDDRVESHIGIGTQIDGLGHVGIDGVHFGGVHEDELFDATGLKVFGIHALPPIVTRGVLLDMASYFDVDVVPEGTAYNVKEITGALERQKLALEEGDVVLFHSGWLQLYGKDDERWLSVQPGLGKSGAEYLAQHGVVAVGADTAALEAIPFENTEEPFIVHQTLLAKNGVYILEYIDTRELAEDKAYEFMFVLGQPKLRGAVQAIINPVAIR